MSTRDDARSFLDALFDGVPGYYDIRRITPDAPTDRDIRRVVTTIAAATELAFNSNVGERNVYVCPATMRDFHALGTKQNLCATRAVRVDVDGLTDERAAEQWLLDNLPDGVPRPSMVVWTGGGLHLYWLLERVLDLTTEDGRDCLEAINRGLVDAIPNADPRAWPSTQPMRVPGTMNYPDKKKREQGRVASRSFLLQADNGDRHELEGLDDLAARGREILAERTRRAEGIEYEASTWDGELPKAVADLLGSWPRLHDAWLAGEGACTGVDAKGRDTSHSAVDMSVANLLAIREVEPVDINHALRFRRAAHAAKRQTDKYFADTVENAVGWANAERERQGAPQQVADGQVDQGETPGSQAMSEATAEERAEEQWKRHWPLISIGDTRGTAGSEYLVDDLVHAGTLGELYGEDGTLKTAFALWLSAHGATGTPFYGLKVRRFATVFVAAEGGGGIERRAFALRQQYPEIPGDSIAIVPRVVDLIEAKEREWEAFTDQVIEDYLPKLRELKIPLGMLWFDTYSQSTAGSDENATKEFTTAERNVRESLRRLGDAQGEFLPAAGYIHHSGWSAGRPRGSSAHKRNLDWMIECSRTDGGELTPFGERAYIMTVRKVKDGPDAARFPYRGKLVRTGLRADDGKQLVAPVTEMMSEAEYREAKQDAKAWRPKKGSWHEGIELAMGELREAKGPIHVPEDVLSASGNRPTGKAEGAVEGRKVSDLLEHAVRRRGIIGPDAPTRRATSEQTRAARSALGKLQDHERIRVFNEWAWWPGG